MDSEGKNSYSFVKKVGLYAFCLLADFLNKAFSFASNLFSPPCYRNAFDSDSHLFWPY